MTGAIDVTSDVVLTSEDEVFEHIAGVCFKKGPPRHLGVEVEWLVVRRTDPCSPVPLTEVTSHLADLDLPGGSSLTFEPGGQLELSSAVHRDPSALVRALGSDISQVLTRLADFDLTLSERAYDEHRPTQRQLTSPRYEAMADYFSHGDPVLGPLMMCRCAGLQVNLDAGETDAEIARRWRMLHEVGPALTAAFCNSPAEGWRSRRQSIWQDLDPARTGAPVGADPVTAWSEFALAAPVMMIRADDHWLARPGVTFGEWIDGAPGLRPPTVADLEYHLTTLFPPVRPRGWFEVRYLDAQPRAWWAVPALVLWALTQDLDATEASVWSRSGPEQWRVAAHDGLADRGLLASATALLATALPILESRGVEPSLTEQVASFADRFTRRGLSPADELAYGRLHV